MALRKLLVFGLAAFVFCLATARAEDDPALNAGMDDAHVLIMKAHDETNVETQIKELEKAREIINHTQPLPLGKKRKKAVSLIDSAIYELKRGDPKKLVIGYLEEANRQVGY